MPAGAVAGSGVLSAGASMFGASQAASAQKKAAQIASQTQMAMYNQSRADLQPYRTLGSYAAGQLQNRLMDLTSPIVMDQATLEKTPGYQFNLSQGLRAAQSSAAARGLGLSGAAIKGAADYATGLADSTYQNQFNNANINQTNAYNRLFGTSQLGASAAGGTINAGTTTGSNIANNLTGAANASGAASIAAGNAIGSGGNALLSLLSKQLNGTAQPTSMYGGTSFDPLTGQRI